MEVNLMNKIVEIRHDSQYAICNNDISLINAMDQPIIENMIQSNKIFTPQEYLKLITGDDYTISGENDIETVEVLLEELGYCLWSYPINEICHIITEKIPVVLVLCNVRNSKTGKIERVPMWFEVDFDESIDDEDNLEDK